MKYKETVKNIIKITPMVCTLAVLNNAPAAMTIRGGHQELNSITKNRALPKVNKEQIQIFAKKHYYNKITPIIEPYICYLIKLDKQNQYNKESYNLILKFYKEYFIEKIEPDKKYNEALASISILSFNKEKVDINITEDKNKMVDKKVLKLKSNSKALQKLIDIFEILKETTNPSPIS